MNFSRRNFLGLMVGGIAAAAAVRTFPFRVYSFPKEPVLEYFSIPWQDYPTPWWVGETQTQWVDLRQHYRMTHARNDIDRTIVNLQRKMRDLSHEILLEKETGCAASIA